MPGPLLAAGLSAGASLLGAGLGFFGGERTNEANARQAQLNRDFQERMRATQYQTAVDDMRKAGLNPALAYQQGGAGTPSGATAQMGNSMAAAGGGAAQAAQTAANLVATLANIEKTEAETARTHAEAETIRPLRGAQGGLFEAQQGLTEAQRRRFESENEKGITALMLEQLRQQIDFTVAGARELNARALIQELGNRPLAARALEAIREKLDAPLGNAWREYMRQQNSTHRPPR